MRDPRTILDGFEHTLLDLPDASFVEAVGLLEQIGDHPQACETGRAVRARMAHVHPARPLSLRRVFCDPFEDLLVNGGEQALPYSIERSVVCSLWQMVEVEADPEEVEPLRRLVAPLRDTDYEARAAIGRRLWPLAGRALRGALGQSGNAAARSSAPLAGSGERRRHQVLTVARLLEIGTPIARMKALLPTKPAGTVGEYELAALGRLVRDVAGVTANRVFFLLLATALRLRRPTDILSIVHTLDFGPGRWEKDTVEARLNALLTATKLPGDRT